MTPSFACGIGSDTIIRDDQSRVFAQAFSQESWIGSVENSRRRAGLLRA